MGNEIADAKLFLEQKLRETIDECGVPALGAVLVKDEGATIISAQQGIRKIGATGSQNQIQPHDRFNLGSISKVFTGNLIGKLVQDGVLDWGTKITDVYASIWDNPASRDGYKQVTIEQLLAHTSGMPYQPITDNGNDWISYLPTDMTKAKLMQRRRSYVKAAVLDPPSYWPPGSGFEYGGGGIIAASISEHLTKTTYEDLLQTHIFNPLKMTNSGFGRLSSGPLDGPWQHSWNQDTFTMEPDKATHLVNYNWHPRNPVGGVCCSAEDLGKFLQEQIRSDPQVFKAPIRATMQTYQVATASGFVRGAWASDNPGSSEANIMHNGDNGVSYANTVVSLGNKIALGAMSNVNSTFGAPAVNKMYEFMTVMHRNWTHLFKDNSLKFVESAHPMPAVVANGQKMIMFARRHDGILLRQHSVDGGQNWQGAIEFPSAIFSSGIAACTSSDKQHIYVAGRGSDYRIWFANSKDDGNNWEGWNSIGEGIFLTGSAIICRNGKVQVFAVGMDKKMYRSKSSDDGHTWSEWKPIGNGIFTSAPAVTVSNDGRIVHLFGRGMDMRIWQNFSSNSGEIWGDSWKPIGKGVFTSSPAAVISDGGTKVHVIARGTDRQFWRNMTTDNAKTWMKHWAVIPNGTFTSAPAMLSNGDDSIIKAFAFGGDFTAYWNYSSNNGDSWSNWNQVSLEIFL